MRFFLPRTHFLHHRAASAASTLDRLHVEALPDDVIRLYAHQYHAAHLQKAAVLARAVPVPLAPDGIRTDHRSQQVGVKVGNLLKGACPVLPHLFSATELAV